MLKENFLGLSPPSVFVGRFVYPNVFTGILVHDYDSEIIPNSTERWYSLGLGIEDIIKLRSNLVFSRFKANIKYPKGKFIDIQQEVAQSVRPVGIEVYLKKKPIQAKFFDGYSPPLINFSNLKNLRLADNPKIPKYIYRVVNDTDLKAFDAIVKLYRSRVPIDKINKILSSGLLGLKIERKLVPTRWSITATDDMISSSLIEKIKEYESIDKYMLFSNTYLGNHYEILLMPRHWSYELIEIKFPGSAFSKGKEYLIFKDYEGFWKRKTYVKETAGGYYAARLGVCEYLNKIRRQASVLILREVYDTYYAPLGVWVPRETVRGAFSKKPTKFESLSEALKEIGRRLKYNINNIIKISKLLKDMKEQKTLKNFL